MIAALLLTASITLSFPFQSMTPTKSAQRDVIYGNDDRMDLFNVVDTRVLDQAKASVALFYRSKIQVLESGDVQLLTSTYGKTRRLCQEEAFFSQPMGAFCTGFLVNENTIVTAGHCIRDQTECDKTVFIFDFKMQSESEITLVHSPDHIYSCQSVVASRTFKNDKLDFAIVTIDRPVTDRVSVVTRSSGELNVGDPLYVIGHPAGLPIKWTSNGAVRQAPLGGFFVSNLDTYGGNSGSPVFHAETHEVEGILVRGETDYVYNQDRQCYLSKICPTDECGGEEATVISAIKDFL